MDLTFAEGAAKTFTWLLTLGKSELRAVRRDVEELINDLRKSMLSLYDVAKVITDLDSNQVDAKTFQPVYDYVNRFYLYPENLSAARTHCGYVERDVARIMFKLGGLLHSDIGRWNEAYNYVGMIVGADGAIVDTLEQTIAAIRTQLDQVNTLIKAKDLAAACKAYGDLAESLKPDVVALSQHVDSMDKANRHLWSLTA